MRSLLTRVLLLAAVASGLAQNLKPVAERIATQNALFDEHYEADLRNFPERATAFGDYRYNDRLDDYSLDAILQRHQTDEDFLQKLQAIATKGFPIKTRLSHDLMVRVIEHACG